VKSAKWHKGVPRLDGAQGAKGVWRPHVRTQGLLGVNVVYWRKNMGHCWDFSAPPVIRHPRYCAPLPRRYATGVTLRWKVHSCEIPRALNAEPLLRIDRSQLRWFVHVSRMSHKRLARQVLLAKQTGKWPRDSPRPSWSDYISDLAWSSLVVEPAELFHIAVDCEVFQVLLGLLPSDLLRGKTGMKMNNIFLI